MQYEDEEPVYIDQFANNNNDTGKTFVLPATRSPVGTSKSKNLKLTKSASTKQLYPARSPESPTKQYLYPKRSRQTRSVKATAHIEQVNFFGEDVKRATAKDNIQKNMNALCSAQNNYKKHNYPNCNLETSDVAPNDEANSEASQPWNSTYKKVKGPQETVESRSTSVYSSPLLDSTDDESFKDARTNLKQLKKVLANRREHFFYGSDSSHTSADTSTYRNLFFSRPSDRQIYTSNYFTYK